MLKIYLLHYGLKNDFKSFLEEDTPERRNFYQMKEIFLIPKEGNAGLFSVKDDIIELLKLDVLN